MPERILRSVFQINGVPSVEDAIWNYQKLSEFELAYDIPQDKKIFDYIKKFYDDMSEPPEFSLVKEYFEKEDDIETVSRLDEVKTAQHYIRSNYLSIVRSEQDRQQKKEFVMACKEAMNIVEFGKNLKKPVNGKSILKGVADAVSFMYDKMSDVSRIETGQKLEGIVSHDSEEVIEEYDLIAKTNKFSGRNLFGLSPVDEACSGHKSGEMWVHCAAPGELKSSLALNYAYNNAYVYEKNIFYAILEMPYSQLRKMVYALHSSHGKFVTEWYEEDKKAGRPNPYLGLEYRKIRDGELNERDYERFKKVAQDFQATCKGNLHIWRPDDEVTISDIKRRAEAFHNKYGCDGIVIDYLGLVKPDIRTSDYVIGLNSVVRESRQMALNFARGKTVPLLNLFQINRQGKLRAEKNDGRYDFAAIAYANQIEKDADVITYTYLDDNLRKDAKFYLGCLKNRDNPIFDRMIGKVIWSSRRMRAIETSNIVMDSSRIAEASKFISSLDIDDMV